MVVKTTRRFLKTIFDRIKNERLKLSLLQALPFWLASLVTGIFAVLYARLFAAAEQISAAIFHEHAALFFMITPLCFLIAWWLVISLSPFARGSGIPQVMASIELANPRHNDKVNRLLSLRIIVVKIFSTLVMVVGGGAVGREGPTIQIAGSVFRKINLWLPDWWPKISKRNMIMTGAAAGLAAAFNTPLGGIAFAVEELTKTHISYFKTALFTAVIIAGLTAQGLLGPYLYLGYPDVSHLSYLIIFGLLIVAVITGISGSVMAKLILLLLKWKAGFRHKYQHLIYITACGLIIVTIAFFIDERVLGSGKELMTKVLFTQDKQVSWYTAIFRMAGPILSFTTGAAGGVFAPALSAGAAVGSLVAGLLHTTAGNANLLILCGMVGFLTGVTRSPFTSAILVLEMTDRHSVIFYLMIAGTIAGIFARLIDRHSFYDHLKLQYMHELQHEDEAKHHPPEHQR